MGGVWQRLAVTRRPPIPPKHSRWDCSSGSRTRPRPRHFQPLTKTQKLANRSNDRSLYRALLRETTYLPDEAARLHVHLQVKARFFKYRSNAREHSEDTDFEIRLRKARANGRRYLHMLQRANAGETKDLLRVLLATYGRLGKRRRELINELRSLDLHDTTPESSKPLPQTRAGQWINYTPGLTPRLKALTISQKECPVERNVVARPRPVRSLVPKIPELNSWNRPMPLRRVKRMTERWWAGLLDKIMPPLTTAEWLRLFELATGRRRPVPPKRLVGTARKSNDPLEEVVRSKNGRLRIQGDLKRSTTSRAVKRALTDVFRNCPHLHYDERWKVTWGSQALQDPRIVESIRSRHTHSIDRLTS